MKSVRLSSTRTTGPARIIDIRQRKVRGEEKTYLQLEVAQGDLTILVPAESVELIGVP